MAKILVIGVGVVGTTVMNGLKYLGHEVEGWDKYKSRYSYNLESKVKDALFIFVCVPTPTNDAGIDLSAVDETMQQLQSKNFRGIVILKSTVLPGTACEMRLKYNLKIVSNPEFLTEKHASLDFLQNRVVLGGNVYDCKEVENVVYSGLKGKVQFFIYPQNSMAEAIKYMANCFLSTKVVFANEFNNLCKIWGIEYDQIIAGLAADPRIGGSHLSINDIGGYGGHCFPKDMKAIAKISPFIAQIDAYNEDNIRKSVLNKEE